MLKSTYNRLLAISAAPSAPWWLAVVSFAESSFFPIPPDTLLIPMVLARPARAIRFGVICTAASVAGGCLGYWIGATLFDQLALPVVKFYHAEAAYHAFLSFYARWGFWAILIKGLTPIPFKLVTIASGAAHFDVWQFLAACAITRGGRFILVEALPLKYYGERARAFLERRLALVGGVILGVTAAMFLALRFI